MRRFWVGVWCLGVAGCSVDVPDVATETFACDTDQDCASGYACTGGLCVKAGQGDPGCTGSACQAPDTTIDSTPSPNSTSSDATFTFHASVSPVTFECKLDGAGYSACTSPATYTGLADGGHHFEVRAKNSSGQTDASAATFDWQITTGGNEPDTFIDSGPPTTDTATVATFNFHGSGNFTSFECQLDTGSFSACSSPYLISALTVGNHVFKVRTTGPQGTDPSPATWSWVVQSLDTTPPVVTGLSGPSPYTPSEWINITFGCNESNCTFACKLDGATVTSCSPPMSVQAIAEGFHTFTVTPKDAANNTGQTATVTWTRDSIPPVIDQVYGPEAVDHAASVTLSADYSDQTACTVECTLDQYSGVWSSCTGLSLGGVGEYKAWLKVTDAAGNPTMVAYGWAYVPDTWVRVSASQGFTCAIGGGVGLGTLWCWGVNNWSQVATAATNPAPTPQRVGLASDWQEVSAGRDHACALRGSGSDLTLFCWGANGRGQLGIGSSDSSAHPPTKVGADGGWRAVSAGEIHTCAIDNQDLLYCWGANDAGVAGSGASYGANAPTPVLMDASRTYLRVSSGQDFACAVTTGSNLFCWGSDWWGRLGLGGGADQTSPSPVATTTTYWLAVAAGRHHACGLHTDGSLYCWGANDSGQIGPAGSTVPVEVHAGPWEAVGAGFQHSCVVSSGFDLYCFGDNSSGQLGIGTSVSHSSPTYVGGGYGKQPGAVELGEDHTCALTYGGALRCWGGRSEGQVGDGLSRVPPPGHVVALPPAVSLSAGYDHTCAITNQAVAYCWGDDSVNQLGFWKTQPGALPSQTPVLVGSGGPYWLSIAAGERHGCGVWTSNGAAVTGQLWCWGYNGNGEQGCGDNDTVTVFNERQVGSDSDWVLVAANANRACGIRETSGERHLYCWGRNTSDELGVGSGAMILTPTEVLGGGTDWQSVVIGSGHICGVRGVDPSSELWCWGNNAYGQLANGTGNPTTAPARVAGTTTGWGALTAGSLHTCAIRHQGNEHQLYCWGMNWAGQLGQGTTDSSAHVAPLRVGAGTDWLQVDAGPNNTCAIRGAGSAGLLWCWGANYSRQTADVEDGIIAVEARVGTDSDWIAVSAGETQTCGIRLDGTLSCWGGNARGQLGDGLAWQTLPIEVP